MIEVILDGISDSVGDDDQAVVLSKKFFAPTMAFVKNDGPAFVKNAYKWMT